MPLLESGPYCERFKVSLAPRQATCSGTPWLGLWAPSVAIIGPIPRQAGADQLQRAEQPRPSHVGKGKNLR